ATGDDHLPPLINGRYPMPFRQGRQLRASVGEKRVRHNEKSVRLLSDGREGGLKVALRTHVNNDNLLTHPTRGDFDLRFITLYPGIRISGINEQSDDARFRNGLAQHFQSFDAKTRCEQGDPSEISAGSV